MAASRGVQDCDKQAENAAAAAMATEKEGQQRNAAQPDSAAEAVAQAPGSGNARDEEAATGVPRRHQVLARTLMKAFQSADTASMTLSERSRMICGCPETPVRSLLRRSRQRQAAGDGAATTEPSRQMIVLRGLVALAAFLAAASVLLSAMFLIQSLRSEHTRQIQKVAITPPVPVQAPVPYMPNAPEANAEPVPEKRHKRRRSRRKRFHPALRTPASNARQHEDEGTDAEDTSLA
ncbi:hypothetical protein HPB50_022233 [Hyalomma asiaticum]|uniref:Uncharacterized protein n=1 Tax=Hyalomma asiaticum TaxID=266040 RepID=A0ACB7TLL8_HYAAI|nr:hypothetical protein HPB50_022233 [Hyalomma asiaticum]